MAPKRSGGVATPAAVCAAPLSSRSACPPGKRILQRVQQRAQRNAANVRWCSAAADFKKLRHRDRLKTTEDGREDRQRADQRLGGDFTARHLVGELRPQQQAFARVRQGLAAPGHCVHELHVAKMRAVQKIAAAAELGVGRAGLRQPGPVRHQHGPAAGVFRHAHLAAEQGRGRDQRHQRACSFDRRRVVEAHRADHFFHLFAQIAGVRLQRTVASGATANPRHER